MNEKLVFLHIPKNGGMSLTSLLSSWFTEDRICPYRVGEDYLGNFSDKDLDTYDYFTGHISAAIMQRFFPKECPKLTVLRDPVDRIYSLYAYWRTYDLPKTDVLQTREKGVIPTLYANELQGPLMAQKHDFGSFLFSDHPYIRRVLTNPQSRFLSDAGIANQLETLDPNFVFDQILTGLERWNITVETLENQPNLINTLSRLADLFGEDKTVVLPHSNKSERIFFEDLDEERVANYLRLISPLDFMLYDHFHQPP